MACVITIADGWNAETTLEVMQVLDRIRRSRGIAPVEMAERLGFSMLALHHRRVRDPHSRETGSPRGTYLVPTAPMVRRFVDALGCRILVQPHRTAEGLTRCGTTSGYTLHLKLKEVPCWACLAATTPHSARVARMMADAVLVATRPGLRGR
jgi:hypothetical protein